MQSHHAPFQRRAVAFQGRAAKAGLAALLISDPDSVYYVSGFWGYGGGNFGRPTMVIIPAEGDCALITPRMEEELARKSTWIGDIRVWVDGVADEYLPHVRDLLAKAQGARVGIERYLMAPLVYERLAAALPAVRFVDGSGIIMDMRMIKDPEEIATMRLAGKVAVAMGEAAIAAIREGVPEYEVTLAAMGAGTRKGAELFSSAEGAERYLSPVIGNLQILTAGPDITMVHRRPTIRKLRQGDSVYLCFCEIANFQVFKLGFDRQVVLGPPSPRQLKLHEVVMQAQAAAREALRPGVRAEEVHAAAKAVVEGAGYRLDYRTGRGIGLSFLERPELKDGDTTVIRPGMTFAVDGGVVEPGFYGSRVGDSVVVTETGCEVLTEFPRELRGV